jgi:NADPH-dependent dioxygenase
VSADPQILIAGAGPVGLSAAHELARRGLRVRVIDAAAGPAVTGRAIAVHPRTLETFDQMGLAGGVLAQGRRNRAFTMYATGRRLIRLDADYTTMPTRYPYTLIVEQTATEAVLRRALAARGVNVEWGVALADFTQDTHQVHAVLHHADGQAETCTTAWLVGCDGGHSTVRKHLGLPLIGTSSETWMLADAPVRTDLEPDTIYWAHTGRQAVMMVPYAQPGKWRLLDTAPHTKGRVPQQPTDVAGQFSARLSAGLGRSVQVGEPEWTSVFTFQQRMVERMHQGRVFLAGDAAHVHSPASGQGMNTGIQEAYNLAWKLAMVQQGHAALGLLETYDEERLPIGRALLGSTRAATFLVQLKNILARLVLPTAFAFVRRIPALRRMLQRTVLGSMSGLRLHYADSPLTIPPTPHTASAKPAAGTASAGGAGGVAAGHRACAAIAPNAQAPGPRALREELRDVRWTLLVAPDGKGATAAPARAARRAHTDHSSWLSVRTVGGYGWSGPGPLPDPDGALAQALDLTPGGWVLIRPDGYLAAQAPTLSTPALTSVFQTLGLAPHTPAPRPAAARPAIPAGVGAVGAPGGPEASSPRPRADHDTLEGIHHGTGGTQRTTTAPPR